MRFITCSVVVDAVPRGTAAVGTGEKG